MEPVVGIAIGLVLLAVLSWGIHYSIIAPRKNRDAEEEDLDRKSSITQHAAGNPVQKMPDQVKEDRRRAEARRNRNENRDRENRNRDAEL